MYRSIQKKMVTYFFCACALTLICSCELGRDNATSAPTTVDLPQSNPKWQSIGNCWVYAVASWIESVALRDTGVLLNVSESYITYRHFEEQLNQNSTTKISTGGSWQQAKYLLNKYGVMSEGDFISSEAEVTYSAAQKRAVAALDKSLAEGALSQSRSSEIIRSELDAAFGVKLADVEAKIVPASNFRVSVSEAGNTVSLRSLMNNWKEVSFDYDFEHAPTSRDALPQEANRLSPRRLETLKRIKRALNKHEPVIMSWYVDFNALNDSGAFNLDTLKDSGRTGRQGWHMIVIEDYVVEGTNPATGERFSVGEGEATNEEKRLAAEFGDIKYLVIKNSWGGSERYDRSSYSRDGVAGYHKIFANYLFSWIEARNEETLEYEGINAIVSDFVIPNGY